MVDGPNKNFSRLFRAPKENGLPDWLTTYIETLQRGYYDKLRVQTQVEKRRRKVLPHEVKAKIEILKKAEAIIEEHQRYKNPGRWSRVGKSIVFKDAADRDQYREHVRRERKALAVYKIGILALRRQRMTLAFRLNKAPRGCQMNYMLDYEAWCLGEKIKEKTGMPNWELVAELLSEYLPIKTMDANHALKAHRRFAELRNDREKFRRVIVSNGLNNNWFGRDYVDLTKKIRFAGPRYRVGPFTVQVIAD